MRCNSKNKRKFQCGRKESSACTEYAGWLPNWSELQGDDCVTVEEVLEEQYRMLDNIRKAIDVSGIGGRCINYPVSSDKVTVAMVLSGFEKVICSSFGPKATVYTNDEIRKSVIKEVPDGFVGTSEEYVVGADSYVSSVSKDDANMLATKEVDDFAQRYANNNGSYSAVVYYNKEQSKEFEKNDCVGGVPCGKVIYTVKAKEYTSPNSQEEADNFALKDIEANGQSYANAVGKCKRLYYSTFISRRFFKSDCPEGYGDAVGYEYSLPNGAVISEISQHDADSRALEQAMREGQEMANISGACTEIYYNDKVSGYFHREDCGTGYRGKAKIYEVEAGACSSFESKDDANMKAEKLLMRKGNSSIILEGECVEKYWAVKSSVYPSGAAVINHDAAVRDGEYMEFEIIPGDDFIVERVVVNGKTVDYRPNTPVSVYGDRELSIKVYAKSDVSYNVSVEARPEEGGNVDILVGDGTYDSGAACIIEASPFDGYIFNGWYKNGVMLSLSKNHAFSVNRDTAGVYVAVFDKE